MIGQNQLNRMQLNLHQNNNKDKGTQTTIASLYWAINAAKSGKIDSALDSIHKDWMNITLHYENEERLKKREEQFVIYDDLSDEEKDKDKVWINAVLDNP